jgi:hypothetical protein
MATISYRSYFLRPMFLLIVTFSFFTFISCNEGPPGKGEWIPIPPDTSALGKINHFIPREDIEKFRAQYRSDHDSLYKKMPNLFFASSEAFNKPALLEVLKDPRCVGIRIYYGVKSADGKGDFRCMIVGVDEQGKDLYINEGSKIAAQGGGGHNGGLEYGQCDPPCVPGP